MPHPVRTAVADGVGSIVLDRPAALNALDLEMIDLMSAALEAWRDDDAVRAVVVTSACPKAFCAGGDIRSVRRTALRDGGGAVRGYFAAEYRLDAAIAGYPKPYVSLIDGYALGGGLGISVHGRFRVVTERAALAMPETAIGFFPDIGAGYFLPRLRGAAGMYLGLTGARIDGAAALACGLATHYVDSAELPALEKALAADGGRDPGAVLDAWCHRPDRCSGFPHEEVDRCFHAAEPEEVLERLAAEGTEWAAGTTAALRAASPSSLVLTHRLLSAGAADTLAGCLERDLRLAPRIAVTPDFAEGVRAALVDKDRTPAWRPAVLEELTGRRRERLLALLAD